MHTKNSVKYQCVTDMPPELSFRLKNYLTFVFGMLVSLYVCNSFFKEKKGSIVDNLYICSFLDVYEDTGRENQSI